MLPEDSPDSYDIADIDDDEVPAPPMYIVFVEAGSRIGYRWESFDMLHPCKVNELAGHRIGYRKQ